MKKAYKSALKEVEDMALRAMSMKGKKAPAPRPTPPEGDGDEYPAGKQGEPQGVVAGLKTGEDQGIETPAMEDFAIMMANHSPEEKKRLKEMYAKIAAMKG